MLPSVFLTWAWWRIESQRVLVVGSKLEIVAVPRRSIVVFWSVSNRSNGSVPGSIGYFIFRRPARVFQPIFGLEDTRDPAIRGLAAMSTMP